MYRMLALAIADDPELMRLAGRIKHTPVPNMIFASIQFLLMRGEESPLRQFYPSLVDDPMPLDDVAQPFKEFALEHEERIVELGSTRYTQTNECKRCIALLPAIWSTGLDRFHLVDLGASAGLNLALDRYRYRWNEIEWGPDSSVELQARSRGGRVQPREIEILSRTGLDLNPIDASDPDDRDWLVALIWPEHHERRRRLERALELVAEASFEMISGDANETLPDVFDRIPAGEPMIVVNSMVLMQLNVSERERLYQLLNAEREKRPLHRVSFELLAAGDEWVTLAVDRGSGLIQIGQAHPHGEWVDLYARP